jgi:hypothetical protein
MGMATEVYLHGVLVCSVCSDDPVEQMLAEVNRINPTGINSRWELAADPTFASGHPNPNPCEKGKGWHYLLEC